MKKYFSSFAYILFVFLIILFSGCSWEDEIENGTYISDTPYIKFTYEFGSTYKITQEIEVDGIVQKALGYQEHGVIAFYEYQEEDINPTDGLRLDDNETYARFYYKFDDKKKQLIFTERETGNVYHLDKVD